jgi:hypothetical protein
VQPIAGVWGDDRVSAVLGAAAVLVLVAALVVAPSLLQHAMAMTAKPFLEVGAIVSVDGSPCDSGRSTH